MSNRNTITEMYYPEKLTAEEFIQEITDPKTNQNFIQNMNNLGLGTKHAEEWIQLYAKWREMN